MFTRIALIALGALTIACGSKKSNKSSTSVQPPVTQQPVGNEPTPAPIAPVDQNAALLAQAVGLYQQSDNSNVYLRIDNQMNVETTLQLPIKVEGSDNRLTPTFPQILRTSSSSTLETLGYVNRGGNTFDNVTLKVTPINNGDILDVRMIVKLRQGDTVMSTSAPINALKGLDTDEHDGFGRRRCGNGCGNGCGNCGGCGGIGIGIVLPIPVPVGFPVGGYPGGMYPGGPGGPGAPGPGAPGAGLPGGTYPNPPPAAGSGSGSKDCTDGSCVGQPLEDKEFVYRFIRTAK